MEQFYPLLKSTPLFAQFDDGELAHMLDCLRARPVKYVKEETVFLRGDKITEAGIIVSGDAFSHREDIDGNRKILSQYQPGDIFFEELLFAGKTIAPFSLTANAQTNIIYIDCSEIPKFCKLSCKHHSKLIVNLTRMMSEKIIRLDMKMEIVQKHTIRDKLLTYFTFLAEQENSCAFDIPFSRQALSDYIGASRSAVSRELWNMKKEGVINFNNRSFIFNYR